MFAERLTDDEWARFDRAMAYLLWLHDGRPDTATLDFLAAIRRVRRRYPRTGNRELFYQEARRRWDRETELVRQDDERRRQRGIPSWQGASAAI